MQLMPMTRTAQSILAAALVVVALAAAVAHLSVPRPHTTSSSNSAVFAAPSAAGATGTTPTRTAPPTEPPDAGLDQTDGGDPERPGNAEPTNTPTGRGSDTRHDRLPAGENTRLVRQAAKFWTAFSLRKPRDRKAAVAQVAVPYLAEQMAVDRTDRIPVLHVRRTAVLPSSFSSALTVSQMTAGGWWYVVFVYDPDHETWMAQEYEQAPANLVSDANTVLDRATARR
jgi:hypothetical protein